MKNKNLGKNYLEKNKTSPLLKTPEKDFHEWHIPHLKVSQKQQLLGALARALIVCMYHLDPKMSFVCNYSIKQKGSA